MSAINISRLLGKPSQLPGGGEVSGIHLYDAYRIVLDERVQLLAEEFATSKLDLPDDVLADVGTSLARVRFGPDGLVDPNTVDSLVSTLGGDRVYAKHRSRWKGTPLRKVLHEYFDILNAYFGHAYAEMRKHKLTPHAIADDMADQERIVRAFAVEAQEFYRSIRNFWQLYEPVVRTHLEDLIGLKAVYGGDISPSYRANIVSSVGLYMDTLVLPDPLVRMGVLADTMQPRKLFYLSAKHALNIMTYRDIALAEVDPPIVVIAPDTSSMERHAMGSVELMSYEDTLIHCSKLFGRQFDSMGDLMAFLHQLALPADVISRMADPSRCLFDLDWIGPLADQFMRYIDESLSLVTTPLLTLPAGEIIGWMLRSRLMQVNDLLLKSDRYIGTPFIDAPTSWQYLAWKYEYNREEAEAAGAQIPDLSDVLITKALQVQGREALTLLTNIPSNTLVELRKQGALGGLRALLRDGVHELDTADPATLSDVAAQVAANLSGALARHEKELADLRSSKRKFFGLEAGPMISTAGSIVLGATSMPSIGSAILAAGLGIYGLAQGTKTMLEHGRELWTQQAKLKRSPSGILFRHVKHPGRTPPKQ